MARAGIASPGTEPACGAIGLGDARPDILDGGPKAAADNELVALVVLDEPAGWVDWSTRVLLSLGHGGAPPALAAGSIDLGLQGVEVTFQTGGHGELVEPLDQAHEPRGVQLVEPLSANKAVADQTAFAQQPQMTADSPAD